MRTVMTKLVLILTVMFVSGCEGGHRYATLTSPDALQRILR